MNSSAWSPAAAKEEPATHTKQVRAPEHKGASVPVPPPSPRPARERPHWVATAHGQGERWDPRDEAGVPPNGEWGAVATAGGGGLGAPPERHPAAAAVLPSGSAPSQALYSGQCGGSPAGGSPGDSPSTQPPLTAGDLGGAGPGQERALCARLPHNASSHRGRQQQGWVPVTPDGDGTHHPMAPSQRGPGLALKSCPDAAELQHVGLRADGILGCCGCPEPSHPHPAWVHGMRALVSPWPHSTYDPREQHGVPAALGGCRSSVVPVSPPQTPPVPIPAYTAPPHYTPPCPACPPRRLTWAASGPQMGAVASDLLTPAGRGQQARCT